MKIIDTFGNPQSVPFQLGQAGKKRKCVEVLTNCKVREARAPDIDVEYHVFEENPRVVYLDESVGRQKGLLVRINTKDLLPDQPRLVSQVKKISGDAKRVAAGSHAVGHKKITGYYMDELWHITGPSIFAIKVKEPGSIKTNHDFLVVTPESEVAIYDGSEDHVTHFEPRWWTVEEAAQRLGAIMPKQISHLRMGADGIDGDVIIPGRRPMVVVEHGPAGGWRYRFVEYQETGLTRLIQDTKASTRKLILAMIDEPGWYSASINYKDEIPYEYVLINDGGVHFYTPANTSDPIRSESWRRRKVIQPSARDFRMLFGLDE